MHEGGIGFDVAEFLAHGADATPMANTAPHSLPTTADFLEEWGIDGTAEVRGGLLNLESTKKPNLKREIYLLQRKRGKHGAGLGKTTGWIHRTNLKKCGVKMLGGISYSHVDDQGLHIVRDGKLEVLNVDTVVVCAGQNSVDELAAPLIALAIPTYKIGGAFLASEIDAKRAIDQASRLAADIEEADPAKVGEYIAPEGIGARIFRKITA